MPYAQESYHIRQMFANVNGVHVSERQRMKYMMRGEAGVGRQGSAGGGGGRQVRQVEGSGNEVAGGKAMAGGTAAHGQARWQGGVQ